MIGKITKLRGIDVCREYLGLKENEDRLTIIKLLQSRSNNNDIVIDPSTTAWCAAWLNFCERKAGNPGNGENVARRFKKYGDPVPLNDLQEGDILCFKRGIYSWQGHVGYYLKEKGNILYCMGGNQGDSVSVQKFNRDDLLFARRYTST